MVAVMRGLGWWFDILWIPPNNLFPSAKIRDSFTVVFIGIRAPGKENHRSPVGRPVFFLKNSVASRVLCLGPKVLSGSLDL